MRRHLPVSVKVLERLGLVAVGLVALACGGDARDPVDCRTVEIADPVLEAWVRAEIDVPDGPIPGGAVSAIYSAYLGGVDGLVDLGGIECFTGLRSLYLGNVAGLVDLGPLAQVAELERLEFTGSQVTDLRPIAGLVHLRGLSVPNNPIAHLTPLSGLTELDVLDISGTQVADLSPIAGLPKVSAVIMQGTPPDSIEPLASLISLRVLDLSGCDVRDATPIAALPDLLVLSLRDNPELTSLDFATTLPSLRDLHVGRTSVVDLTPMAEVPTLEELDLYDTQVADLSPLVGHPRLTSLNVSHTRIADLALVAGIAGLKSIYAAGDHLVDVSPIAGHAELAVVDISDNDITSLAPLADVAWQYCGTLVTNGNPLDAASSEDVLPALCDRHVIVESDDGDCWPPSCWPGPGEPPDAAGRAARGR